MTAQSIRRRLDGLRILVVDDDPIRRDVVRTFLEDQGCLVLEAINGADAAAVCLDAGPPLDAVIMDNEMPVLGGMPATAAIRTRLSARALPIFGLSSRAGPDDRCAALAAGMNDYLPKPFDPQLLLAALMRHLPSAGRATS